MTKERIVTGIDVGSFSVRTIIARVAHNDDVLRVLGVGSVPSLGMRRGFVVDVPDTASAIASSVELAEKMAGVSVGHGVVGIGGVGISVESSKGVVAVGKADGEVTEDDVSRVLSAAQAISVPMNKEIVHVVPRSYRLDDQSGISDPLGMRGVRLEVDALIVESPVSHVRNLAQSVSQARIDVEEMVFGPLAASFSVLDKRQKELGVAIVDLGATTTSIAIFEEGEVVHVAVLPVGAGHVTNDIAIGLRTSVDVAEKVKLLCGSVLPHTIDSQAEVDLSSIDSHESGSVQHRHVADIIHARLEEIFDLIHKELASVGKAGLLPAGVVLVGGGAHMPHIVEFSKDRLGLPIQIGYPQKLGGVLDKVDDPAFATVVGLVLWSEEHAQTGSFLSGNGFFHSLSGGFGGGASRIRGWFEKFLP
ncbi:MAG: cell division protein FtsA [Candidatus Moranbacteria bacterium]|nr:cell division protein FtsA [Candidatus Moranbacteria bacterium]